MRSILMRVGGRYGRVYDSYAVTRFTDPYPGTDGIHYGPTEANAWSRLVARDLTAYAKGRGGGAVASSTPRRGLFGRLLGDRSGSRAVPARASSGGPPPGEPKETVRRAEPAAPAQRIAGTATDRPDDDGGELEIEIALRQKSEARSLAEITYRSALGIFEYDVIRIHRGSYSSKTIRIAHLIVRNNQYTSINRWPLGHRKSLLVERLARYPNLLKLQTFDDLEPAYDLPVFVPKL
jgi:hypothetical protein